DVGDLSVGAPVMMADITVGQVKSITLDHNQALVNLSIEPSAHVPVGVIARVRRTSLLGERIIHLVVPSSVSAHAALRRNGKAIGVLKDESDRLIVAVKALARLAGGTRAILDKHSAQMIRFFAQMHTILGVLRSEQASIAGALRWAPFHNRNTQLVEYQQFNQVLQDFIICGMNDSPKDPARRCYK